MFKKFSPAILMATLLFSASCSQSGSDNRTTGDSTATQINNATHDELVEAVNDRDQLLVLVNDIQQGLIEIKSIQEIATVNTAETPDRRAIIKNDLAAIQQALADRRSRLQELEKKLASSNLYSDDLKKTVTSLHAQIESQTAEIARLNGELTQAKSQIADLNTKVDSLNTNVETVTGERNAAEERASSLTTQLNTCYYVLGSKKELKAHNIIDGSKVLQGNFDKSYFTASDKRTLKTINTYAKKAKILTKQPEDSYVIETRDKIKYIVITNPERFWGVSNYLVVQIN